MREFKLPTVNTKPKLPFTKEQTELMKQEGWGFEHYDCGDGYTGCRIYLTGGNSAFKRPSDVYSHILNEHLNLFMSMETSSSPEELQQYRLRVDTYAEAKLFFNHYCPEQHRIAAFEKNVFIGPHKVISTKGETIQYHEYVWNVCSCRRDNCDICNKIGEEVRNREMRLNKTLGDFSLNGKTIEVNENKEGAGVTYEYFACSCKEVNKAYFDNLIEEFQKERGNECPYLATNLISSLNCNDWYVTNIYPDQWAVIMLSNEESEDKMRIQCDQIEHGLIAAYHISKKLDELNGSK